MWEERGNRERPMSAIRQRLEEASIALAGNLRAADVRIGLGYTAVFLEDGRAGLAYTFPKDAFQGCTALKGLRPLTGRRVARLIELFRSDEKTPSSVALAACNALFNTAGEGRLEGDALDFLDLRPEDRVGMVGCFTPLIPVLKKRVASLAVFEEADAGAEGVLPGEDAYRILPRCQAALITSTSIINRSVDGLLEAAAPCRDVVLLGASTPLAPEVFSGTPVSLLSGVVVSDPAQVLRIVSEGGGTRLFRPAVKKVNVRLRR